VGCQGRPDSFDQREVSAVAGDSLARPVPPNAEPNLDMAPAGIAAIVTSIFVASRTAAGLTPWQVRPLGGGGVHSTGRHDFEENRLPGHRGPS
jgi:hypothetical protein